MRGDSASSSAAAATTASAAANASSSSSSVPSLSSDDADCAPDLENVEINDIHQESLKVGAATLELERARSVIRDLRTRLSGAPIPAATAGVAVPRVSESSV